jgi:hypothetical protein
MQLNRTKSKSLISDLCGYSFEESFAVLDGKATHE